jgi:hypothetical protein
VLVVVFVGNVQRLYWRLNVRFLKPAAYLQFFFQIEDISGAKCSARLG